MILMDATDQLLKCQSGCNYFIFAKIQLQFNIIIWPLPTFWACFFSVHNRLLSKADLPKKHALH